MRVDLVVVTSPLGDAHFRLNPVPKPLQAEILVAQLPVEGFVGRILPRLAGVNQRRFDLRGVQPAPDGSRDKLRRVVRAQVPWAPCTLTSWAKTSMTRGDRMLPATSIARHSRVSSSTTVSHLRRWPLAQ